MGDPLTLKILVIGNSLTGKTNLVNKWTKNIFCEEYKATIGTEFGFKIFKIEGQLYQIQLWDLSGLDENFKDAKIYAKDVHGAIILSDATDYKTREE